MYTIRDAGVKGLGVYAATRIQRGTRIFAERPILKVNGENEVFSAARALSPEDRVKLFQLSVKPVQRSAIFNWMETAWHGGRQLFSTPATSQVSTKPQARSTYFQSVLEYSAVLDIFRNNNFDIGGGVQAVFGDVSRMNHACVPNAQGNFNKAIGRFTVHAVRQIELGEEINLSYLVEHGALRASRQSRLLNQYGFICDCPACDSSSARGKDGEQRRLQMQTKLHQYAEEAQDREGVDQQAELEMVQQLVSMYEAEGIAGRELATMCLTASQLSAKIGRHDEASALSEKGLQLDRDVVGLDNPLYQQSLAESQALKASLP